MDKIKQHFPFSAAPPIAILGVPFDNITTEETIQLIEQMVVSRQPHYLATANVDFLVQASKDVELRRILLDAHLVLCDGTPLVWASRLLGNPLPERVAGSDLVPLLLRICAEKGFRPFFLGATPEAMQAAIQRVTTEHPSLQIAGYYSPPFSRLLEMNHEEICQKITQAQPDILLVGFGCPKQEKWINMHYRTLGVPVSVGVGGTIDFLAGKLARAPMWMRKTGTEWIFRLLQEPKRLAGRYAKDLWYFSGAILAQYWRLSRRKRAEARAQDHFPVQDDLQFNLIEMPPRLDFETVHRGRHALESAAAQSKPCLVNLGNVQFIDSTGVGLLIRLQKRARLLGQQLVLVAPTGNIHRALHLMKLQDFFIFAPDISAARKILHEVRTSAGVYLKNLPNSPFPALAWNGEITAANAEEIWAQTIDHLAARSLAQRAITIDISGVGFIDSTGLSVMIRAKKYAGRRSMQLMFTQAQPNVMNVIRLSRLEDYLFGKIE